jgi:hypothetical protein
MRAGIDPETGRLGMPSVGEAKAIDLPAASQPLPPVEVLADGAEILRGKGHFLNYSLVQLGANGAREIVCVAGAGAATHPASAEHAAHAAHATHSVTTPPAAVTPVAPEVR